MAQIQIQNLTFAYEGSAITIFDHVHFQIDTQWKLGFIGRNGRGKTTFLNLLQGKLDYEGTISAPVSFAYFPYQVSATQKEAIQIVEEIHPTYVYWELLRELRLLELNEEVLYRPFHTLSQGEQTKLLFAVLFLKENAFLLIDEPTNHLDQHGREIVQNYLNQKKGFILVSHDRDFLDGCIDHVLSINRNNIEVQKGTFSSWFVNKQRQDQFEQSENEKLKKEIGRLEQTKLEKANWSKDAEGKKIGFDPRTTEKSVGRRAYQGAKSKKMMKRAMTLEKRQEKSIDEKSKLLKNIEKNDSLQIHPLTMTQSPMVTIQDFTLAYGNTPVFQPSSFDINPGDRIALCGKNGSGKSSILKALMNETVPYRGKLWVSNRVVISYVPQETHFLKGYLSSFAKAHQIDESLFKAILRKLDFSRGLLDQPITNFSAGQKKKVLIAKSLCERAHLYLWDEPLNYVDVLSRIQIEELLLTYAPTILFIEHDKAFCNTIATKQIFL